MSGPVSALLRLCAPSRVKSDHMEREEAAGSGGWVSGQQGKLTVVKGQMRSHGQGDGSLGSRGN